MGIHIFHLVLHRTLKKYVIKLSEKLDLSQSETVIQIIKKSLPIAEKYQFTSKEHDCISKCRKISWKTQLHIYMDEELFRKIRHLCDSMFAFSTAIVVRKLIGLYFLKTKKNEGKNFSYLDVLNKYERIFVAKYKNKKNWDKITKQLYYPFYYQLAYNDKFAVVGFNLLN